jgi:ribonuclease-3 family protein
MLKTGQLTKGEIQQLTPIYLAYIGDAVYELYIRTLYLLPKGRMSDYHKQVVDQVKAETQANQLRYLEPYLTDIEKDILRRGRNAATGKLRRVAPEIYQQATSFETLIGYLYLSDSERLDQLLSYLKLEQV